MSSKDDCAPLICGLLFGALVGIFLGLWWSDDNLNGFKAEAATKGHAEYYLNENHKAQWRWKDDGCVPSNRAEGAKEGEHGD